MKQFRLGAAVLAAAVMLMTMTGCDGFFVDPHGTGTATGAGSTTNDYVYAANSTTNTLTGYAVGKSVLTPVGTSSALLSSFGSTSVAVSRANTFVYVGGTLGIVGYSIGTNGTLTALNSGSQLSTSGVVSLDTSPDGQWLFGLDQTLQTVHEYKINPSTGALTQQLGGAYLLPKNVASPLPRQIICSPQGNYVVAILGTSGLAVFPFNTTTGVMGATPAQLSFSVQTVSFNGGAIDSTGTYLYVSQSGLVNGASANGVYGYNLVNVANGTTTSPIAALVASGSSPGVIALNIAGTDLYVVNRGDQTISGYSVSNGVVTPLSGSPYTASPALTGTALVAEKGGTYLLEGTLGSVTDVAMFSYDGTTTGKLDASTTALTGTDSLGPALAVTH